MTTEATAAAPAATAQQPAENSPYELFMGVLSILSLIVMFLILVAQDPQVADVLLSVDLVFCGFFLLDFIRSFARAPSKRAYMWPRGLLDLLSSVPGIANSSLAIFRLFRLFRIARVARIVRAGGAGVILKDFLSHREQSIVYLITLAVLIVVALGSIGEVYFEADTAGANITTAGDALWWALVTITTVGYGDQYPITTGGRLIGVLTMATGIAIFGVITSLLSSFILGGKKKVEGEMEQSPPAEASPERPSPEAPVGSDDRLASEVAGLRQEIAQLRSLIEQRSGTS
jgi:voltage-gated potassium channel